MTRYLIKKSWALLSFNNENHHYRKLFISNNLTFFQINLNLLDIKLNVFKNVKCKKIVIVLLEGNLENERKRFLDIINIEKIELLLFSDRNSILFKTIISQFLSLKELNILYKEISKFIKSNPNYINQHLINKEKMYPTELRFLMRK